MRRLKAQSVLILFLYCVVELYMIYGVGRSQTGPLLISYALLFLLYLWIIRKESDVSFWIVGAMIIRFVLLASWPSLSDDFYRFVWDGRLMNAGFNPFTSIPADMVLRGLPGLDQNLFEELNSKNYYSVYPPVAQ